MNKPFLVTGAGGFVGTNLVRALLERNYLVRAMVRNPAKAKHLQALGVEIVEADMGNPQSLEKVVDNVQGVFHIAALFRQAGLPDQEYMKVNTEGTRALLDASIRAGVRRFVHCSTVGVHGDVEHPPANEDAPFKPGDIYQVSKLEGEKIVTQYFKEERIRGVVIRPAMIYGPGDERIGKVFRMIAKNRFFYIGKGNALVHFIDVRDLCRAFILGMEKEEINNRVYIIAGEQISTLSEVVNIIADRLGVRRPWLHLPVRPMQILGDVCEAICTPLRISPPIFRRRVDFYIKNRAFDISRARQELGYHPAQSLMNELHDILSYDILTGTITPKTTAQPMKMLRSLDGNIVGWDEKAEKAYGFSQSQAVGKISHQLLKTEFPDNLDDINNTLIKTGQWQGNLVHTTAEGKKLRVSSLWEIQHTATGESASVLETNCPVSHTPSSLSKGQAAAPLSEIAKACTAMAPLTECLL